MSKWCAVCGRVACVAWPYNPKAILEPEYHRGKDGRDHGLEFNLCATCANGRIFAAGAAKIKGAAA